MSLAETTIFEPEKRKKSRRSQIRPCYPIKSTSTCAIHARRAGIGSQAESDGKDEILYLHRIDDDQLVAACSLSFQPSDPIGQLAGLSSMQGT
jgi:hypothetical protein